MEEQKKAIMSAYTDYVLEHNKRPKNVFSFVKEGKWEEKDFYAHFANFDQLEKEVFGFFAQNATDLVHKAQGEQKMEPKEALMTWYFTAFEVFTQNRSYVLWALNQTKNPLKNLGSLQLFKKQFLAFHEQLDFPEMSLNIDFLENFQNKSEQEALWVHFLSVLRFWIKDTSEGFEKTDTFIEKSLQLGLELREAKPLDKFIDFGKFMWNEKSSFFA